MPEHDTPIEASAHSCRVNIGRLAREWQAAGLKLSADNEIAAAMMARDLEKLCWVNSHPWMMGLRVNRDEWGKK